MDEHTEAYPAIETVLSDNKEQIIDTYNLLDESQRRYAEWKKPVS